MKKLILAIALLFSVSCNGQPKQQTYYSYRQNYFPNVFVPQYSENTVKITLTYITRLDTLWKLRLYNNDRHETITYINSGIISSANVPEGMIFGYTGIDSATKAPFLLSVLRSPNKSIMSVGVTNRQWLVVMYIYTPSYSKL